MDIDKLMNEYDTETHGYWYKYYRDLYNKLGNNDMITIKLPSPIRVLFNKVASDNKSNLSALVRNILLNYIHGTIDKMLWRNIIEDEAVKAGIIQESDRKIKKG